MSQLIVYKNRTNIIQVDLGIDVSDDTITSEIRVGKSQDSDLIATWDVDFLTDGEDGMLVLTIDDSELLAVTQTRGFMDMKRISAGEPYAIFDNPIRVRFREVVTE